LHAISVNNFTIYFLASLNAISDLPEPVGRAIRIIFCIGKKII